jgi:N-acetylmuramoyl-L-alanine amidase
MRVIWLFVLSLCSIPVFAGELTGIRLSSGPSSTRLVLDLDGPASHQVFRLDNPERVVIDLASTDAIEGLIIPNGKGRVQSVRAGSQAGGTTRIVLDLEQQSAVDSFQLAPEGQFGHRLVIDLAAAGTAASTAPSTSSRSTAAPAASAPAAKLVDQYTGRDLVIAIDAGHGGNDSGTHHNGVREKDIVLQIAKRLAALVEATPGMTAVMTRTNDNFIDLDERVRIARTAQADFFISIHADSYNSANVSGATVYSIKTERALRESQAFLGNRQAAGQLVGTQLSLAEVREDIATVLVELARDSSITKSRVAGDAIIDQLSRVTTMLRPDIQQKSLSVLTSPDVPSLLIETGFVTNPAEAKKLRDANFQQALAQAMLAGIVDFFRDFAPTDSYFAHNPPPVARPPIRHVIARGETLSEIAARYRTSVSELRRTNQISGDVIRVGQELIIPTSI